MNPIDQNSPFNGPLTPHQFKYKNENNPTEPNSKPGTSRVKYAPLIIAGLALLVLPVTIWQINSQQDLRQRASQQEPQPEEQNIIAKYKNKEITESNIDEEYTRQQNATVYTVAPAAIRKNVLNDLITRMIIEDEAKVRSISVSDEEIEAESKILEKLDSQKAQNKNIVKDLILKEKLEAFVSGSRTTNIVFSNNNTTQSESFFTTILDDAKENEDLLAAAKPYAARSSDVNVLEDTTLTLNSHILSSEAAATVFEMEINNISELITIKDRIFIVEVTSEKIGENKNFNDLINERIQKDVIFL